MSTEYEQVSKHSWCTDYVHQAMESTKGPDSLSLLVALLVQDGSVVHEAFVRLGLDPAALRKELIARKKELGASLEEETWIVDKATRRAKAEGFRLASDHLLEVIWDEESEGAKWLSGLLDPDALEQALNESRYPNPDEPPFQAPLPSSAVSSLQRDDVPDSHETPDGPTGAP